MSENKTIQKRKPVFMFTFRDVERKLFVSKKIYSEDLAALKVDEPLKIDLVNAEYTTDAKDETGLKLELTFSNRVSAKVTGILEALKTKGQV